MADRFSELYQDLLSGSYDCVDRIVLNGYFRQGHSAGGFRVWWQKLTGSVETLGQCAPHEVVGAFQPTRARLGEGGRDSQSSTADQQSASTMSPKSI
jgi:hypothetical protein